MKTMKQWDKSGLDLDQFLNPLDQIDWDLFSHIVCGYVASNYDDGIFGQCGEAMSSIMDGDKEVYTYETVRSFGFKYFYIGILPDMNIKKFCNRIKRTKKYNTHPNTKTITK